MKHAVIAALALVAISCTNSGLPRTASDRAETAGAATAGRADQGTNPAAREDHAAIRADQIEWKDGPASLPPGARFAVLEGDPAKEGYFAMRIRMPDGYRIPPHWHPNVERVTVISGTFNLGMGETFNQGAAQRLPAGSYTFMQPGMKHFASAGGETEIQLTTLGPWAIHYVNPSDDPRKKK